MGEPYLAHGDRRRRILRSYELGPGTTLVDVFHQGRAHIIGTGVLEYDGGLALVDPGPTACLPALKEGLGERGHELSEVTAVLLTHIHLDHATATGAIVREAPGAVVYVHPRGAPHMVDPTRLLASAGRIYGDAMDTLWGAFLPVPGEAVREVDEGDRITLGDRSLEVAYVPGHAKHHVAYFEPAEGAAWVGDVGGIRLPGGVVVPVTPPPDIDVEVWRASMERVAAWSPERLIPTHFGPVEDPAGHFEALDGSLEQWSSWVRTSLEDAPPGGDEADENRAAAFAERVRQELAPHMSADLIETYDVASGFPDSWWGLARYWRKRLEGGDR